MSEPSERIYFRAHTPEDTNFIYATWLNSYYFGSRFAERITKTIYYDYHQQVLEKILTHPDTKILIACNPQNPNTIFGYLVHQTFKTPIIQYIYVKGPFQKLGIAAEMIREAEIDLKKAIFTHWTFDTNWIMDKYPELTYIPYLIS